MKMKTVLCAAAVSLVLSCVFANETKPLPEMKLINIVPLQEPYLEKTAKDMRYMEDNGMCTMHAVTMTIIPEGNCPDKMSTDLLPRYKKLMEYYGKDHRVPVGILIGATIGHSSVLDYAAIQRMISATRGTTSNYCPLDKKLQDYVKKCCERISSLNPDFVIVDDDTRLTTDRFACVCPLHLAKLSEKLGRKITAEELKKSLNGTSPEDRRIAKFFDENNKESIAALFKKMREGFDVHNPSLQVILCECADDARFSPELCKILAGKGNPTMCRINNARYWFLGESNRTFPEKMYSTASQIRILKNVDCKLAEVDPYFRNRYATSARILHSLFASSIVEGCTGAKFWPNMYLGQDDESSAAYKKLAGKYCGFYNTLMNTVKAAEFTGVAAPLPEDEFFPFNPIHTSAQNSPTWEKIVIGRMGFPLKFARAGEADVFTLDGPVCRQLSDSEIKNILSKNAMLDADAALDIQKRGMGKLLGVKVSIGEDPLTNIEIVSKNAVVQRSAGETIESPKSYDLSPASANTEILSRVYRRKYVYDALPADDSKGSPAATFFRNELGGKVVVISGKVSESVKFLCSARKKMLTDIFNAFSPMDAWYAGDAEMYLKCAKLPDGSLFVYAVNLGLDTVNPFVLQTAQNFSKVLALSPDGRWLPAEFSKSGDKISIRTDVDTMLPVAFKLEK